MIKFLFFPLKRIRPFHLTFGIRSIIKAEFRIGFKRLLILNSLPYWVSLFSSYVSSMILNKKRSRFVFKFSNVFGAVMRSFLIVVFFKYCNPNVRYCQAIQPIGRRVKNKSILCTESLYND